MAPKKINKLKYLTTARFKIMKKQVSLQVTFDCKILSQNRGIDTSNENVCTMVRI